MNGEKVILDACCGSRMFWFDKQNPHALFADVRDESHILCDGRKLEIHPDIISDFTNMPFSNESFKLVVLDPPHLLRVGENSWLAKKYGRLPENWRCVIRKAVDECFRVLEDYGVLIFKWNEDQVTVKDVIKTIERQPLFGHTTGRHGKTMWMCFMKIPN
jgi:ubiquinone/menaquinone biosynthesis C-methylase UbiE